MMQQQFNLTLGYEQQEGFVLLPISSYLRNKIPV
jgi:hypothetical protein